MAGVNDLPCADPRCAHPFGEHTRTGLARERGACQIERANPCPCQSFVWEPYEEDPDRAWDDYKAGYTDIDGNVLEPSIDEPEDY